jgi:hypothetical protein
MSNQVNAELQTKSQQLLDGPLKHVRAAALAAALLPLASIAATPASAQTAAPCPSGGTCGIVFVDNNGDSMLDSGDTGIDAAPVTACQKCDGTDDFTVTTDGSGNFQFTQEMLVNQTTFDLSKPFSIFVVIPTGTQVSPPGFDSVGVSSGNGLSVISNNVFVGTNGLNFAFTPKPTSPGTGTPGYWKNHPDAWPVASITIGTNTYTKAQAIGWLSSTGKDKSVTMFQSYVSAYLSIKIGNDGSCVSQTMSDAYDWLVAHPVGSAVAGGSAAWAVGQPTQSTLDAYDNGLLCAPHRK